MASPVQRTLLPSVRNCFDLPDNASLCAAVYESTKGVSRKASTAPQRGHASPLRPINAEFAFAARKGTHTVLLPNTNDTLTIGARRVNKSYFFLWRAPDEPV